MEVSGKEGVVPTTYISKVDDAVKMEVSGKEGVVPTTYISKVDDAVGTAELTEDDEGGDVYPVVKGFVRRSTLNYENVTTGTPCSPNLGTPCSPNLGTPCSPNLGTLCSPIIGTPCSIISYPWNSVLTLSYLCYSPCPSFGRARSVA
jgi:hypothetical protein